VSGAAASCTPLHSALCTLHSVVRLLWAVSVCVGAARKTDTKLHSIQFLIKDNMQTDTVVSESTVTTCVSIFIWNFNVLFREAAHSQISHQTLLNSRRLSALSYSSIDSIVFSVSFELSNGTLKFFCCTVMSISSSSSPSTELRTHSPTVSQSFTHHILQFSFQLHF